MKKGMMTLVAVLFLSLGSLFAQSENGLIGKARGAAHDCLSNYNGKDWQVGVFVNSSPCIVSGQITTVYFYAAPVMPPCDPEVAPCPVPLPIVVAEVSFDCDGQLSNVVCY